MGIDIRGMTPLLLVFDMPRSIRFYRDILGFEIIEKAGPGDDCGWALLALGNVELMLNETYEKGERPSEPDLARVSAHGDTALFFGCEDLDEAFRYLRAEGVEAKEPVVRPYGMKQLYVTDPDGYTLCFQWPSSEQARQQWSIRYGTE